MKVLVVDDDPSARSLLEKQIGSCGFDVTVFPDAEAAWEACQQELFSFNIVDLQLRGMGGLEFCRRLRTLPGGKYCVILVVTGRKQTGDLQKTLEAGADDYLAKPISLELMRVRLQVAKKVLSDNRTRRKADEALRIAHGELQQALRERGKELACLYGIAGIVERPDASLDEILEGTVKLLPSSWQYPEITCARILVDGKEYKTARFEDAEWMQTTQVSLGEGRTLTIEVGYLEARPSIAEGPFLEEERHLIDAVAERLARIIERMEATHEAETAREQLALADRMATLGTLVAGVAHEINNPNNFVMINAPILQEAWTNIQPLLERCHNEEGEFLLAGVPYTQMRDHIPALFAGIIDGSRRMNIIVDQLKDYARNVPSDMTEPVAVDAVLKRTLLLLGNLVKRSTDHLRVSRGERLPLIHGNSQRIEQVLINVIQNACQALPDSSKGLFIETEYDSLASAVIVRIRDEGIGISPEDQEHILDPFFTTKRDIGGTGLGLSICATIMDEHEGTLTFDSQPGQGTTVTLTFPAKPPPSFPAVDHEA